VCTVQICIRSVHVTVEKSFAAETEHLVSITGLFDSFYS